MRVTSRSKREEDVLTRMRFGHTGLNESLYRIAKHLTGICVCGQAQELVEHVLINCCKYQAERRISLINKWYNLIFKNY